MYGSDELLDDAGAEDAPDYFSSAGSDSGGTIYDAPAGPPAPPTASVGSPNPTNIAGSPEFQTAVGRAIVGATLQAQQRPTGSSVGLPAGLRTLLGGTAGKSMTGPQLLIGVLLIAGVAYGLRKL